MNPKRIQYSLLRKVFLQIILYVSFLVLLGCHSQSVLKTNLNNIDELSKNFNKTIPIRTVKFNPQNNAQVALSLQNSIIYLYDFNKNIVIPLAGHKNSVFDVAFNPDGTLLASAGFDDKTVRIWDVTQGKEIQLIPLSQRAIKIAFSSDGHYLAIAIADGINKLISSDVVIWDIKEHKEFRRLQKHFGGVSAIAFSPDGEWLVSSGFTDKEANIWKWREGDLLYSFSSLLPITSLALSPDKQWLITNQKDGLTQWRNLKTGDIRNGIQHGSWATNLIFTSDIKYLISGSYQNKVIIQHFPSGIIDKELSILQTISRVDLSSDNQKLAISVQDGTVRVYDFQQKQLQHLLIVSDIFNEWLSCDYTKQQCVKNTPPFDWVKFFKSYLGIILILLAFFILISLLFYVRIYKHPLVLQLSDHPEDLLKLPLQQLPEVKKLLRLTWRLSTVLARCNISYTTFNQAILFLQVMPEQQASILNHRLMSKVELLPPDEALSSQVFLIKFTTLRLNLENCLFYFPESHLLASDILQQLEYQDIFRNKKVVVITAALEKQQALRPYGENLHNEWIIPNAFELTLLLLSVTPVETFSKLLSNQLSLVKISPYQISGALRKDESFFGRTSIISDILSRDLKNYVIVGGRQIGKSSLLQYLYRQFSKRTDVNTFYYSYLYGENILQRLAMCLNLAEDSTADQIMNYLTNASKPHIFLLDEIDGLVESDKQLGYINLYQLRSFSSSGKCYFILAGVWHLYQSVMCEYTSPLRNFGELITLAELETEACHELIVKPLNALDISLISESLIAHLTQQTGQRANLIALVCNEIVRCMDKTTHIVNKSILYRILYSNSVQSMFGNQNEQALDNIVMYLTAPKDKFTVQDVLNELNDLHYPFTSKEVRDTLQRLTLELVLKETTYQEYTYAIPLMRENLLKENLKMLIDELISHHKEM